jgi:ABC-type branched-subunit amino acid transport system ATPase component
LPATVPALRAIGVTVRFGGRVAVDEADLVVGQGEVVGLIGTNGAGKSTLMNAIGGFVPARGGIEILGRDATRLPPARRARLGLGRTFQTADLFADMTVLETVQVSLEARERATLPSTILSLPKARHLERRKRAEAGELIAFFGLGRYQDHFIDELSTGTRRIVELACLIGLEARMLCLDEPTAGVAQRETEAFAPLVLRIREELGASVLVVEHDMPFIMGISDRVYCLEAGRIIAEGVPDHVRHDPAVISSYLGTDERAIERSDAVRLRAPTAPAGADPEVVPERLKS